MSTDQQAALSPQQHEGQISKSTGLAVAGLGLALLGIVRIFYCPLVIGGWSDILVIAGLLLGGLVCGITGLVMSGGKTGKGLSVAAIVLAAAALVVSVVINVLALIFWLFIVDLFQGLRR